jgi:nucleotide-binding universal stress UspA family protein
MNRILVGLDASPRAPGVLAAALDLAQRTEAKLILFRSVGIPVELPPEALAISPGTLADLLERQAEAYLQQLAAGIAPERLAGIRVSVGTPWQAICAAANDEGADLIVIGSHGYHGLDRLIGTTAGKVVNHADRSVLVVREPPAKP